MNQRTLLERQIEQAERTRDRAEARLALIMSLPDEPTTDDPDGALVLWFTRRFRHGGTQYTYAAVKAGDGLWYLTGGTSPQGLTWDRLSQWLWLDEGTITTVWVATDYAELT